MIEGAGLGGLSPNLSWTGAPTLAVMADFGQTDFGQFFDRH